MKVKTVLLNLFKQPEDPKKPRPIFIIGLVVVLLAFGFNMLGKKGEESTVPDSEPSISLIDKVKGVFGAGPDEVEPLPNNEVVLPNIPVIPESSLTVDQALIDSSKVVEQEDFKMIEVTAKNEGRRDPMKSLEGENVGSFDKKRIEDKPSDLLDESKDYFGGIAIDDIIFDSMQEGDDDKVRGTFIVHGSIHEELTVGDYLAEMYYVKTYNQVNNYVVLQYQDKTFKLKAQNILKDHQGVSTPTYK